MIRLRVREGTSLWGKILLLALVACGQTQAADSQRSEPQPPPIAPVPAPPDAGPVEAVSYLKGSTHVHTAYSGDSSTPIDDVVAWYVKHGYDFIVVTDHNRVTDHAGEGSFLVLRGIELTHNPGKCEPPPPEPDGKCRIHVNGLVLAEQPAAVPISERPPAIEWKNGASALRVDMYQAAIDKSRELGGLAQINHPTWHHGVDGELLAELARRGAVLVEIANQGFKKWNLAAGPHPSAEAVWDQALSRGALIWGVASDDAHDYDDLADERQAAGARVYPPGGGWVMVRAARRPEAIRRALERGEFYASTGVTLDRAEMADGALEVSVVDPGDHEITFIGPGGAVLERVTGRAAKFSLSRGEPGGYVRATITRADGASAWVQPVPIPR